jgi:hypothetical protein
MTGKKHSFGGCCLFIVVAACGNVDEPAPGASTPPQSFRSDSETSVASFDEGTLAPNYVDGDLQAPSHLARERAPRSPAAAVPRTAELARYANNPVCDATNRSVANPNGYGCRAGDCYRSPLADSYGPCAGQEAYWCPRSGSRGTGIQGCRSAGAAGTNDPALDGVTMCCPATK